MAKHEKKIISISSKLEKACMGLLVIIPVMHVLIWLNIHAARKFGFYSLFELRDGENTNMILFLGFMVSGALSVLVMLGINHLRQFFKENSNGKLFSASGAEHLHRFSVYMIFYAFLTIPTETVLSLILSLNNPVGERLISVSFTTENFRMIFVAFVLSAISWIIKESVNIADDNAKFV